MSDQFDEGSRSPDDVDDAPRVTCARCDAEWTLEFELDELQVGNRAVERFALDHERHTGHFPDGVTPWIAVCRQCPDREAYLSERPARRWAEVHARHTRHEVSIRHEDEETATVEAPGSV